MNPRICRCCGEAIPEEGNALSRNPNVCASCSSMADGMEESNLPECADLGPERILRGEATEASIQRAPDDKASQPVTASGSKGR
jgi:hypothetical protein